MFIVPVITWFVTPRVSKRSVTLHTTLCSIVLDKDDDVHDSELFNLHGDNQTYEEVLRIIRKWQVRVGRAAMVL